MGQRVIADNWSLQAVSELLSQGLDQDDNPGIAQLTDSDKPAAVLPQAVIDLEALFDLLTDVVLRDQILVDDHFHDAWFGGQGPLVELARRSIVQPHPFQEHPERLEGPRKDFLRRLILNQKMAQEQAENEKAWSQSGQSVHRFSAQLVWGGAGMLARAWVNEAPYTPHPLRRRLFERAGIVLPGQANALNEFNRSIAQHRSTLFQPVTVSDALYGALVILPALPALVLREATSLTDMFVVATQMRAALSELRTWLSEYQEALAEGQIKAIASHSKRLRFLTKDVERALGQKSVDAASLNIGWSWLKLNVKLDPKAWLPKLDRIQVQASKLTFAPRGGQELRKLLGFFGHQYSALGLRTMEHFSSR